jgi:single-stranded-DNA-specific exonuclease
VVKEMKKRWIIDQTDPGKVAALQSALQISPVICSILVQRGISNFEDARSYFRPQLSELHDPFLMKDMGLAVDRIRKAIDSGERILVYGDYDVDGTTSVACMYQFLCRIYTPEMVDYYVPHRYKEGYGISLQGIEYAAEHEVKLMISLDCGIKSAELIQHAKALGIDFIVCDHHLPGSDLPPAIAILNPKQSDCPYPYKELCGCGVGFKLICALAQRLLIPETETWQYLDLVATAIAADIVPMTGENRILAYYGLKQINENPSTGIKALINLSKAQKPLNINNVVFIIAPRVNAAGRMDDARKAIQMFIEQDLEKATAFAQMLHDDNTDRREADSSITGEALAIIQGDIVLENRKSTVIYQPHWHKGVIGIVASRLMEHYYRPTIVLTKSGEVVSGSARSIPGFNIHEGLHQCQDLLLGFGGHYFAAGMTMSPDNVLAFAERFEEIVSATVAEEFFTPELSINAELNFDEITPAFFRILSQMEPFGPENNMPVFIARGVRNDGRSKIVKEKHIRFSVMQKGLHLTGIGFNLAEKFSILEDQNPVDLVFTIDENEWNNEKKLQLKVSDLRPSI